MKKEDKSTNNNSFENVVKKKLQNFSVPVDETYWKEIDEKLKTKQRRKTLTLWISVASVAASIAILWLIFPFNSQISINYENEYFSENESHIKKDVLEEKDVPASIDAIHKSPHVAIVSKREDRKSKSNEPNICISNGDEIVISEKPEEDTLVISESDYLAEQKQETNKNTEVILVAPDPFAYDDWELPKHKKKTKSSMGLLASIGNNYTNPNSNPILSSSDEPDLAPIPTKQEDIYSYSNFSKVKHAAPISFGISVRKELHPTVSIESGLIYTYLYTKFENTNPYRDAKMQVHYLGIPLNFVVKIHQTNSWQAYASFGGMIEKGIHSLYKQKKMEAGGNLSESTISGSVEGVQFSLNAALGIEYKLDESYSIYFEPKAGYFFENDQPVSIRTEHPFNIGIAAGIRINLN
ncbi:porin family protein [Bacteroidales bacterium OttesenSCG-928-M11]|nr:porin family protein [Bacteroidales bacterium OttesenSCG-928-M11]